MMEKTKPFFKEIVDWQFQILIIQSGKWVTAVHSSCSNKSSPERSSGPARKFKWTRALVLVGQATPAGTAYLSPHGSSGPHVISQTQLGSPGAMLVFASYVGQVPPSMAPEPDKSLNLWCNIILHIQLFNEVNKPGLYIIYCDLRYYTINLSFIYV